MLLCLVFFFQAEDGIRDLVRSRGLGDVYKRQLYRLLLQSNPDADLREKAEWRLLLSYLAEGKQDALSLIHI